MAPPQIVNREQSAAWNGPEGAHWAEVSERRVAHADLSAPLLDAVRIESADAVLDVGCGIGEMTLDAARRAADGSATGIDLSELMIERARISAAAAGVDNASSSRVTRKSTISFQERSTSSSATSDRCSSATPWPHSRTSRPVAPRRESGARVPAGDGSLHLVRRAARRAAGRSADAAFCALGDVLPRRPDRGRADAARSRLRVGPVPIRRHIVVVRRDLDAAVAYYLGSGQVRSILERDPDLTTADARERLERVLERFADASGVWISGSHWILTATRSG